MLLNCFNILKLEINLKNKKYYFYLFIYKKQFKTQPQ
jgi:hypothetical protein